ncbi:MAG: ABC transporter substrate-binding protein [Steroidobacteraceae bacterium]
MSKRWMMAAVAAMVCAAAPLAPVMAAAAPAADAELAAAAATVDASDPGKLIDTAARAMLKQLDAHRADYRKDPARTYVLLDQVLLPHFDTQYAANRVLGTHRQEASPEQVQRFIKVFYNFLLKTYADRLVDFTGDRLQVNPYRGKPDATSATVNTKIRKDDGTLVQVDYSLRKTADGWKAWDVVIEGISATKSFKEDFDAEITQKGLDALIQRLESQGTPANAGQASAGKGKSS